MSESDIAEHFEMISNKRGEQLSVHPATQLTMASHTIPISFQAILLCSATFAAAKESDFSVVTILPLCKVIYLLDFVSHKTGIYLLSST